ncbi:MAG: DNA-3-methyladenine glycosylase, partial [Selenomonadaceae bacterium]|nr:DNA-3-methyladenine glycosylase [Selenomonadaceae bacterium]
MDENQSRLKLPREFYLRDGLTVARELIGKKLVTNLCDGLTSGIIVETEAYMGKLDAAAHSYKGLTERTKIFYGAGGFVYVYLIYGRNLCTNVVANVENVPEAVLIRAIEPVDGIELMKIRRGKQNLRDLCSGPGKLSQALGVTKNFYGADLCGDRFKSGRTTDAIDVVDVQTSSPRSNVTKDFYG